MRTSNLLTVVSALSRLVRMSHIHSQEIANTHNLTGLSLECLRWIAAGQPVTTEDLSERFDINEPDLMDLLDSLHDQKLINISPMTKSNGPIQLEITLASIGLAIVETATAPPLDHLVPSLAKLPDEELQKLADGMRVLDRVLIRRPSPDPQRESWPLLFGSG